MKKKILFALATGFGLGYSPFAPGTSGSVPGFLLVWWLSGMTWITQAVIIAVLYFAGIMLCNSVLKWCDEKDPGFITIDEIVSLPVTFFMIPLNPFTLVCGFVLNRILDIIKPWPAFSSQNLKGGTGIMTDDIISAFYSNIIMHILVRICGF